MRSGSRLIENDKTPPPQRTPTPTTLPELKYVTPIRLGQSRDLLFYNEFARKKRGNRPGVSPLFKVRTHSTCRCGLVVRYQQLSWIRSQAWGNVLAPDAWVSGLVSCVLRASCPNSRGFDQSSETGLDLRELGSILAACPAHRAPSPEDDICRAQGGCPTKEGSKPWVIAPHTGVPPCGTA